MNKTTCSSDPFPTRLLMSHIHAGCTEGDEGDEGKSMGDEGDEGDDFVYEGDRG